jgi:hypothetical protein
LARVGVQGCSGYSRMDADMDIIEWLNGPMNTDWWMTNMKWTSINPRIYPHIRVPKFHKKFIQELAFNEKIIFLVL